MTWTEHNLVDLDDSTWFQPWHTHIHAHTKHAHTHPCTRTCTRMHKHMHAHVHTHTHNPILKQVNNIIHTHSSLVDYHYIHTTILISTSGLKNLATAIETTVLQINRHTIFSSLVIVALDVSLTCKNFWVNLSSFNQFTVFTTRLVKDGSVLKLNK